MKPALALLSWIAAIGFSAPHVFAQEQHRSPDDRSIAEIRDGLYQVRDRQQYSVFLVTADGIILGDPLNVGTATWLKEELAARFPGQPVRYVLHSHHHFDRAGGAAVFDDTAEIVAHRHFNTELRQAWRGIPPFLRGLDRNHDGKLERAELADTRAADLIAEDRNHDGFVTPDELYRFVHRAEIDYDVRRTITLGGRSVVLVHTPSAHAPDTTLLFFPSERAVFAVDHPAVGPRPFAFGPFRPVEVVRWLNSVNRLDFDLFLSGSGDRSTRQHLTALDAYLQSLFYGVVAGYEAGMSVAELQASNLVSAHRGNVHYVDRNAHIAVVYPRVRMIKTEFTGAAMATYDVRDREFCEGFTTCTAGGVVTTGTAGMVFSAGRLAVVPEFMSGAQSWSSRTSPFYDEEFAVHESRASLLIGYSPLSRSLSYRLLGGLSGTLGHTRGMSRVKEAVKPTGGRHAIATQAFQLGISGGIDLLQPIGDRLSLVVPVRVTYARTTPSDTWPSRIDVQAGAGLAFTVRRRIE